MQKNRWSRKFDWFTVTGTTSGTTYVQRDRGETYQENRFIAVGDIYFKLNKYLTGVTFIYINSLNDIYKRDILTGDGFSIFNMYNEYDVIHRVLRNIVNVDVAADTNIDLSKQWFSINDVKLRPGQFILLKSQTNPFENDVYKVNKKYFLENAGLLSTREKSDKFSCSVKMGKNIDKQFFLNTNGGFDFPTTFESKNFIEGRSIILKNLIRYNMFNTYTGATSSSGVTSKMIFTDYNLARKQLPSNYSLYTDFYETVLSATTPSNYVTIDYHHNPSYKIRSGSNLSFGEEIGSSLNSNMNTKLGTKLSYSATTTFDWITGDYVNLLIYSGLTIGSTVILNMNSFIKTGTTGSVCSIYLEDVIPNYILNNLNGCSFVVKNFNVASSWVDAYDKIKYHTPYVDFYDFTGKTTDSIKMLFTPKDNPYDKYFDYCDLKFRFTDTYELKYFETKNHYINYTLYDRLSQIDPILFNSGLSVFNSFLLTDFSYQYTDKTRIKITTSQSGLTSIFKPYTYVNAFSSPPQKTLVYSVKDHEMIIERPAQWTGVTQTISAIQNIDGLKNISDILYEVYLNENYDWYIHKSDNERKYISSAYGEILTNSATFRDNVTGLLFENQNNEFILKLYKIVDDDNNFLDPNLYYKTIELVYVGSEGVSRLPVPLTLTGGTIISYSEDWNVLNDGYHEQSEFGAVPDDVLDGRKTQDGRLCSITGGTWNQTGVIGDTFDGGQDVVVPTNTPALLYNVVDGGFETTSCCNMQLTFTVTNSTATVNAFYGSPNYTYIWSNGQRTNNTSSSSNTATGLTMSVPYSVLVVDGTGCEVTGYVTIYSPTTTTTLAPTTLAPTTTTTLAPTTTTITTSVGLIYYGTGTTTTVTSSYILSTFSTTTGNVGSPTGRLYTFGSTYGYRYFAIPDLPNLGSRVIQTVFLTDDTTTIDMQPSTSFYSYSQLSPEPPSQPVLYGKLDISGVTYRLYRSATKFSESLNQFKVYSF